MGECAYCVNILSPKTHILKEPWDTVLWETPSFVVVPTVGALVEGWVLIISKRHVPAMGALTLQELFELEEVVARVRYLVRSTYGSAAVFEHGPACEGTTFGCGVDHAHFHIVPLNIPLTPLVGKALGQSPTWATVEAVREVAVIHSMGVPYLYILENDSDRGFVAGALDIPSQFMRRIIASELGIPNLYDYKQHKFRDNVVSTVSRLKSIRDPLMPILV
jgi:diadenosine tetraphosphate (Ap4A) HIT family hydrolase